MDEWTDFLSSSQWRSNAPSPTLQSPNDLERDIERDIDTDTTVTRQKSFTVTNNGNRLRPYSYEKSKVEAKLINSGLRKVSDKLRNTTKGKLKPFGETTVLLHIPNGTNIGDYKIGQTGDKLPCNGAVELNGNSSIDLPLYPKPLEQFRRAARTVQILLKAVASSSRKKFSETGPCIGRSLEDYAKAGARQGEQQHGQEYMSFTQIYDEQNTAKRTYDLFGISFDPTIFRANREKNLSSEGKAILSMDPSERTDDRLHIAMLALNQTVEAFGEFPIKLQRSLSAIGWYENFEAKRVIIRQGHMADNFYLILSGTAVVTILETKKETGEQCVRTVAFLRKGNSFGELALMHGARRSATVTCKTDVELLAVRREDFIDIFMHIEQDRDPEHIQFLRTMDILRGWPIDRLPNDNPRICLFTYFRRGVLLCRDSNTTEWIYVIKSGTCRVLKDLFETKPNVPGLEYIQYSSNLDRLKLPTIPQRRSSLHQHQRVLFPTHGRTAVYRHLPIIPHRTPEQLLTSAIEHQSQLNDIYNRRHNLASYNRNLGTGSVDGSEAGSQHASKVFVQIQTLGPRDTFGLEQTAFSMMGETTGCSLVSEGAECILINRKFFLQHLSDEVAKQIRKSIQPIPTEESLQQKLQDKSNWDAYKTMTVSKFVVYRKLIHDQTFDALYF